MTEQEWLACASPEPMLRFIFDKMGRRKARLFACACCRRVWDSMNPESKRAVEVSELLADDLASKEDLWSARTACRSTISSTARGQGIHAARAAVRAAAPVSGDSNDFLENVLQATQNAALTTWSGFKGTEKRRTGRTAEEGLQTGVLRHLTGNPFHPCPANGPWPAAVIALAEALYAGEPCGFALHDALLEMGHPALAEHFAAETGHPKGCWVVDLLLAKE